VFFLAQPTGTESVKIDDYCPFSRSILKIKHKQNARSSLTRRDLLKYGLYGSLTAGLSSSLFLSGCGRLRGEKKPSVLLITVDTLRPDHLGCYGYSKNTSPNIDQLAAESLLFENCLSHAPETRHSFASILSGFLPHETKITLSPRLPKAVKTLSEILQRQGYKTAAVVSNYVLQKKIGWAQGFTIYDDTMNERELVRRWPEKIAEHTTTRAIELLRQFHKKQLFMWVHYQDPHGPYAPPSRFALLFRELNKKPRNLIVNRSFSGRGGIPSYQVLGANRDFYHYVSQYDGEIRYQDDHLKRLIDELKNAGLYDEALIIFSSDHGEGMGEHNYYFAHGENLYSSLTHVPLIIKYGNELSGRRTDFVQHIDLVPTILKILGLKVDSRFRGRDLRTQGLRGREIFSEMSLPRGWGGILMQFSLVIDGLKLIYTPQRDQYQLFNLKTDPYETSNLFTDDKHRGQAENLKVRLNRIRKEDFLGLRVRGRAPKYTDEELEKLKSLGYTR
jgi:arylsulfatase